MGQGWPRLSRQNYLTWDKADTMLVTMTAQKHTRRKRVYPPLPNPVPTPPPGLESLPPGLPHPVPVGVAVPVPERRPGRPGESKWVPLYQVIKTNSEIPMATAVAVDAARPVQQAMALRRALKIHATAEGFVFHMQRHGDSLLLWLTLPAKEAEL